MTKQHTETALAEIARLREIADGGEVEWRYENDTDLSGRLIPNYYIGVKFKVNGIERMYG